MYTVSSEIYDHVAELLIAATAGKNFFSGSVTACDGEVYMRFTATLVIYRDTPTKAGRSGITGMEPVWWECHTLCGGEEILNDFSFATLREHAIGS